MSVRIFRNLRNHKDFRKIFSVTASQRSFSSFTSASTTPVVIEEDKKNDVKEILNLTSTTKTDKKALEASIIKHWKKFRKSKEKHFSSSASSFSSSLPTPSISTSLPTTAASKLQSTSSISSSSPLSSNISVPSMLTELFQNTSDHHTLRSLGKVLKAIKILHPHYDYLTYLQLFEYHLQQIDISSSTLTVCNESEISSSSSSEFPSINHLETALWYYEKMKKLNFPIEKLLTEKLMEKLGESLRISVLRKYLLPQEENHMFSSKITKNMLISLAEPLFLSGNLHTYVDLLTSYIHPFDGMIKKAFTPEDAADIVIRIFQARIRRILSGIPLNDEEFEGFEVIYSVFDHYLSELFEDHESFYRLRSSLQIVIDYLECSDNGYFTSLLSSYQEFVSDMNKPSYREKISLILPSSLMKSDDSIFYPFLSLNQGDISHDMKDLTKHFLSKRSKDSVSPRIPLYSAHLFPEEMTNQLGFTALELANLVYKEEIDFAAAGYYDEDADDDNYDSEDDDDYDEEEDEADDDEMEEDEDDEDEDIEEEELLKVLDKDVNNDTKEDALSSLKTALENTLTDIKRIAIPVKRLSKQEGIERGAEASFSMQPSNGNTIISITRFPAPFQFSSSTFPIVGYSSKAELVDFDDLSYNLKMNNPSAVIEYSGDLFKDYSRPGLIIDGYVKDCFSLVTNFNAKKDGDEVKEFDQQEQEGGSAITSNEKSRLYKQKNLFTTSSDKDPDNKGVKAGFMKNTIKETTNNKDV
jgi:hypothetical protein